MSAASRRVVVAVGVALVVQLKLAEEFSVVGIHLDLLIGVVLAVAVANGPRSGAVAGFCAGLGHDVFSNTPIGAYALAYLVAAYLVGAASDGADEPLWVTASLAVFGTAVTSIVYVTVCETAGVLSTSLIRAVEVTIVMAAGNLCAVPFVARALRSPSTARRDLAW